MHKDDFIKQATNRLKQLNIPYQVDKEAGIFISADFKKEEDERGKSDTIVYYAQFFIDEEKGTVYAYEKAEISNKDITQSSGYIQTKIKTGGDSLLPIGVIVSTISYIASTNGFKFEKTDDLKKSLHPLNYHVSINDSNNGNNGKNRKNSNETEMKEEVKTVPENVADLQQETAAPPPPQPSRPAAPIAANQQPIIEQDEKDEPVQSKEMNRPHLIILIIIIALIIIAVIIGFTIGRNKNKSADSDFEQTNTNKTESSLDVSYND